MKQAPVRHFLEDQLVAWVAFLVGLLPRFAMLKLGAALGGLVSDLDRRHTRIAADNLRGAFPEWDEARVLASARGMYAHFGQVLLDILWLTKRSKQEILALAEVEGLAESRAAIAEGRGTVIVTAHLGNWELGALLLGWLLQPSGVVGRPLDNPRLDRRISAFRARAGNQVIPKWDALRAVLKRLRSGGAAAFVIDQNVQPQDGIFVTFFGRSACTTTVAATLALRVGCPIVAGRCLLQPDGRYLLKLDPPRRLQPGTDRATDIEHGTQELTSAIESWIREDPVQWLWMHRRWQTQPKLDPAASATDPDAGAADAGRGNQ